MTTLLRAVPAVLLALALTAGPARADGSRELTDSGGVRPYLEAQNGLDATSGIPRDNRIYAWVQPGETLLVASSSLGVGAGGIELTRPDGTVVRARDLPACWNNTAAGTARALRGRIANVGQEVAGPLGSTNSQPGGYNACEVTVGAGQGGIWRVHFTAPRTDPGNPITLAARAAWSQPTNTHTVSAWDVTVRSTAGANVAGRAWARYLPINTGDLVYTVGGAQRLAGISSTLYAITRDGYRWTVDHNGLVPFGAIIMATRRGFIEAATGDKGYTSVTLADLQGASGAPPAYRFKSPEQFDVDGAESTHKLFFAPLAADLPATAPVFFSGQTRTDWIYNRAPRQGGQVASYRFVGADGVEGQVDPSKGGRFEFQTDGEGAYTIRIDRDRNPSTGPNGFEVDLLRGQAKEGANTVPWDGTDENGDAIAPGLYEFEVGFVPRRGEIHFPYFDAELNPDGIVLTRTNGPGNPDRTVYWDDRRLGTRAGQTGTASLAGTDSQNGAHRWGQPEPVDPNRDYGEEFGNEVGIDTWAYIDYAEVFEETAVRSASVDLGVDVVRRTDPVGRGGPVTYDVVVTNNGPDAAPLARLTDTFPAALTDVTWSCAVTTDAPGPIANRCSVNSSGLNGTGNIAQDIALNPGAALTFTVRATHDGSAGPVENRATVAVRDAQDTVPANDTDADTFTPNAGADLRLAVSVDDAAPAVGDVVEFTVALTNDGPSSSTGSTVATALTGDLAFESFDSPQATYNPGTGTYTVNATVAPGATVTARLRARVTGRRPGALTAQVQTANEPDADSTPGNGVAGEDDQDAAPVTPALPDLAVTALVDDAAPALGEPVAFTVTLRNDGPAAASGVAVTVPVPAGYGFVSAAPEQGSYDAQAGTWTVADVPAGQTVDLVLVATAATARPVRLTAEVTAQDQPDADSAPADGEGDDRATVDVDAVAPDLALAVSASDPTPLVGRTLSFTVDVASQNGTAASGVDVAAALPAGYTLVSATPSQGTYSGGTWSVGPVAGGGTARLVLDARPTAEGPATFKAEVSDMDQPDEDSVPGNDAAGEDDQSSVTVSAQAIDLALAASVDDPTPALGSEVTYTIEVDNSGSAGATGVDVAAALPAGVSFTSASPSAGSYDPTSGVWTVGALAASGRATLTVTGTVTSSTPGPLVAQVATAAEPDRDSTPGNGVEAEDDQQTVTLAVESVDLSVDVSASTSAPVAGEPVTLVVDLANAGTAGATGVDLEALLPPGYTFQSATPSQGAYDAASGAWAVGPVAAGGSARLEIVATAAAGQAVFSSRVTAQDQPDADSAPGNDDPNEDDQDQITLTGQPIDLSLAVSVDDATPDAGRPVTFTVDVANAGPADASGVRVAAPLPAGYTFVSSTAGARYDAQTGVWTLAALAAGQTRSLSVTATAQTLDASTFTAQVSAADQSDTDSTPGNGVLAEDDQDAVSLQARPIDLSLVASVDNPSPALGENVRFSLRLANAGPAGATGVTVAAPLPAGYTFVSSTPGVDYDPATGEWTIGPLAAGQTLDLQIVATATTTDPVVFAPEVTAADQPDADSQPGDGVGDDAATVAVSAQPTDLALAIAASDPAPAVGDPVTFVVTVDNQSGTAASGVDVSASLPAGLQFVSSDPSQGTYDAASGAWAVGSLGPNGQATLRVTATVVEVGPQSVTAQVAAQDQPDADSAPNNDDPAEDDQATVTVTGQPTDLALAVAVSDPAPAFGDPVTFTVTVDNQSQTRAAGVRVAAPLPAGYTFVSSTAGGSYDPGSGRWTVGEVAASGTRTLEIVATVRTVAASVFGAEITAANPADADSTPGNGVEEEDDQAAVAVQADGIDLSLVASVDDPSPAVGSDVTFSLQVANAGPADATGVRVRAPLPAGYTFVSSTPGVDYDPATGEWTVPSLAAGQTLDLQIVATATTTDPVTFAPEVTAADQPDVDSTPGDGTGDDAASVAVAAQAIDLELTASVDDASPALGQRVTYTVTLDNASTAGATGVAVAAALPAGVRFESAAPASGTYDAGTGRWTVGPLAAGGTTTLTITGTVASTAPDAFAPEVAAADQPDVDSTPGDGTGDDAVTVVLSVRAVDLELALAVSDPAPVPGQQVTFSLGLANAGTADATGVTVSAPLPAGFTYVSSTPGVAYDPATGTWTVGTLAASGGLSLDIVATAGTTAGAMTAEVAAMDQSDIDSAPGNGDPAEDDLARVAVTPQVVDLALDMTVDEPQPNAGDVVTFVVTLTNEGDTGATGVQVSDRLVDRPGVAEVVSATPSRGTFDGALWTVGPLAAGASETLTVRVRLVADRVAFTNLAEVARADQPDRDSAPYNGSTAEDDDAAATATTGGSSSGGEGGLESGGSLAEAIGAVLFARRAEAGALADAGVELAPVAFSRSRTAGASLRRFLPTTGPRGSAAVEVSPTDLLPVTNAREIVAADYVRGDGRRAGVVFAAATDPGEVYEHTKPVCDRLRGATLAGVELVDVAGHPFVMVRLVQADGSVDYAVSLVAYGPAASRTVDSRFLLSEYDAGADEGEHPVLNLQAWSPSREHTAELVRQLIIGLEADGPLAFRNSYDPPPPSESRLRSGTLVPALPTVFVRSASYAAGRIDLDVYNAGGATTLHVTGGTLARAEGGGRTAFERTVEVARGTPDDPSVPVSIDTGYLFDAAFFVASDLSPHPDRLYLADGTWGVATDRSSGPTRLDNFAVRPQADDPAGGPVGPGQRLVERPVRATGTVATWATVYRTLRPSAAPVDLSAYRYVEFTAAGEGEVQLLVQKGSVASADQYGRAVRLTPGPRAHRVWFEDLHRADGARGFTGGDVVALSFTARSDGTPRPLDVAVSGLRFGGADGDASAVPDEPSLWAPMPNPFSGSTRVRYELAEPQRVRVRVFDVLGREVARLADGDRAAGRHTVPFDGRGLAAGVYVVRLEAGGRSFTRQMTLVR